MNQYLGEIKIFPQHSIPENFLPCNGQEVYINEYPRLYMIIGHQYGGDNKLKFRLPILNVESKEEVFFCIATEGQVPK